MTRDYSVFVEGTLVKINRRLSAKIPAGTLGLFTPPPVTAVMSPRMVATIRIIDDESPYLKVAMKDIDFVSAPLTIKKGDRVRVLTTIGKIYEHEATVIDIELRLPGNRPRAFVNIKGRIAPYPIPWMMPLDISNTTFKNLLERGD